MPSRQTLRFSGGNREDKENRGSTSMVTMIQEDSDDDGPILYRDDDDDEMEDEGKHKFLFIISVSDACVSEIRIRIVEKIVKSQRANMTTGPYFTEMTTTMRWKTKVNTTLHFRFRFRWKKLWNHNEPIF